MRLGKFYGPDGPGGMKKFNVHYFQYVAFYWWPLVLSGMIILYYFAFYEYNITTEWLKIILDPLRNFAFAVFKHAIVLRVVWRLALIAHFCEAVYAVNICIDIGSLKIGSWFVQTLLLGYPSLRLLLKRQSLGVHKNDVDDSSDASSGDTSKSRQLEELKKEK